jgi:large subunit ribosomal protein L14
MGQRRVKISGKRPLTIRTVRGLNTGSRIKCIDNSGAKICEIAAIKGYHGTRGRQPRATIGDMVFVAVKSGTPEYRKKLAKAVITSMRKEFRRADGTRIKFEENTCVLVDDEGGPKGSEVKAVIAKEAIERWNKIGKVAKVVV